MSRRRSSEITREENVLVFMINGVGQLDTRSLLSTISKRRLQISAVQKVRVEIYGLQFGGQT